MGRALNSSPWSFILFKSGLSPIAALLACQIICILKIALNYVSIPSYIDGFIQPALNSVPPSSPCPFFNDVIDSDEKTQGPPFIHHGCVVGKA